MIRALAVVTCLAGVALAETRPRYGESVDGSLLGAPVTFDPVLAQAHADVTVAGLVFDTLYAIGLDGATEPHLALGPPVRDPARPVAHVALRPGVQLHDGTALTAGDVADSLARVRAVSGWLLAPVAAVRAAGDGIDLELRVPSTDVATLLALPQTAIAKRAGARPVGSGPFTIERFDPAGRQLVLKAFESHFAGRPYVDQLTLHWFDAPDAEARRFETGLAQYSARGPSVFKGDTPKYAADSLESAIGLLVFVGFGRRHVGVTREPAFRQALDLALDRGALSTITTGEQVAPTRVPLPRQAGGAPISNAGRVGDPDRARAGLRAAAARAPALAAAALAGVKLAIVVEDTRPDDREIALRVARALDKLGVGFVIQAVPADQLRDRVQRGDCDLWIGQLTEPLPVATAWWGAAFAAGNDDWARAQLAGGPLDPAAASSEFARRLPIVPLMFRSLVIWYRKDVHGLAFDASGRPGLADLHWPRSKP